MTLHSRIFSRQQIPPKRNETPCFLPVQYTLQITLASNYHVDSTLIISIVEWKCHMFPNCCWNLRKVDCGMNFTLQHVMCEICYDTKTYKEVSWHNRDGSKETLEHLSQNLQVTLRSMLINIPLLPNWFLTPRGLACWYIDRRSHDWIESAPLLTNYLVEWNAITL